MRNKQKNILYLLHLPPPVHGSSMVGEFVKDSQLINNGFRGRYINLLMSRSVHETGKTNVVKMFRFVLIWFQLFAELIRRKPDLCYYALTTTGAAFRKDCLLVALLRGFRVKTIYHLHNKGIKRNQEKKMNDFLYRFVFKNSDVILLSEHLYPDVAKYVSPDKVYYCPNGIKDHKTNFSLRKATPFKILFLSNLIKTKGVFDLIDACALLLNKGCRLNCDFVGGEGDVTEEQFNAYVKQKGLTEHIKYLGKRFGKPKEMAYGQANVFVLPTHYPNECFPLVILEAMQHGLPVISTFEGGIPDMVEDGITGFLIPQHNVDALAERIELLMLNPILREQMGRSGKIKYENNFTLHIFEHKLLFILQDAINKKNR